MSLVPGHLNTRDPEAIRGTARVRAVEPLWFAALDQQASSRRRTRVYVVWGPHFVSGGWSRVCEVGRRGDGQPDWDAFVIYQQRMRGSSLSPEETIRQLHADNEARIERNKQSLSAIAKEKLEYGRAAVAADLAGASRFSSDDVLNGLRMADEGRTKAPPKGQVFSLPGEGQKAKP